MNKILYEKIKKSSENIRGLKEIEDNENPFLDGPCLLGIAGVANDEKSIAGMAKEAMKIARLRVRGEKNAKFDLNDFPVRFLSISTNINDNQFEDFLNQYLYPLVSNKSQKIDISQAMKNIRNINIISYCDGTQIAQRMENALLEKMKEVGYNEQECNKIQSQMCMFPIATNRLTGDEKSTCISFKDINDIDVNDDIDSKQKEEVEKTINGEKIFNCSERQISYLYNGDAEHSLSKYTKDGRTMHICLSSVVSKALENSIENSSNSKLIPITIEELTSNIDSIIKKSENGVSSKELMEELDNQLTYGGARRMTDYEVQLLDELDKNYDTQISQNTKIQNLNKEVATQKEKMSLITESIEKNCSEMTACKIRLDMNKGQWGLGEKYDLSTVMNSKSDKQLIEELERFHKKKISTDTIRKGYY